MNVILVGVKNFLELIENNWTLIVAIIGLGIGIFKKVKSVYDQYKGKSKEEQLAIAKKQIAEGMLKWITDAEVDYKEWSKAGSIKRSQVINKLYEEYPILSQVADQEELTAWIDATIDSALEELRKIIENQGGLPTDTQTAQQLEVKTK